MIGRSATPPARYAGAVVAVCLDDNLASEFASGALTARAAAGVEAHLAGCRDCRGLVAALAGAGGRAPSDDDSASDHSDLATAPRPRALSVAPLGRGARARSAVGTGTDLDFKVGDRIGRYLVIGHLGAGGMGVVLSAYDPQLDRRVAIKLLRSDSGLATTEGRARLIREAKAIAQLSHPNVVGVYDVGTVDATSPDDLYLAMELVEGDTLTRWLQRWPRPWRHILDVMLQAGRGLAAAHAVGLTHRDFKPDNVLVGTDGRVRVGDFGLARSVVGPEQALAADASGAIAAALHGSLTATGTVLGTPRFMAPEQVRGDDTDARSDQFSYCVTLYDAIYGCHPLDGENAVAMVDRGARAKPPPDGAKVPAALGRAILRGLEPMPGKRFPSMDALLAELSLAPARPRRVLAAVAIGLAAAGAATAAVLARPAETPAVTAGLEGDLIKQIDELRAERDALLDRVKERVTDETALTALRAEVSRKNDEIQQLITALETTRVELVEARRTPTKPTSSATTSGGGPTVATLPADAIRRAVADLTGDLAGCFEEWAARYPSPGASLDTSLNVEISVSPEGKGSATRSTGQGSLPICVRDVLTRVAYPGTGSLIRVIAAIRYRGGAVLIEPRIIKVTPKSELIDLRP